MLLLFFTPPPSQKFYGGNRFQCWNILPFENCRWTAERNTALMTAHQPKSRDGLTQSFLPKDSRRKKILVSFTKIERERESGAGTNVAVSSESIGELRSVRELSALLVLYSLPPLPLVLSGASAQPLHPRSYY